MATSKWSSSLASVETAIRRSLGIAGPLNAEIASPAMIVPVQLVDDATRPGSRTPFRGRRWTWAAVNSVSASSWGAVMRTDAPNGVVVRAVTITLEDQGVFSIGSYPPGADLSFYSLARGAFFVDPCASGSDFAPLLVDSDMTSAPPGSPTTHWQGNIQGFDANAQHTPTRIPCDYYLPLGGALVFGVYTRANSGDVTWVAEGEVY